MSNAPAGFVFQRNGMDLRSLGLKKAYSSDFDDILHDFYIPALRQSSEYWRLAGFFSSTSLTVAARGILGLIRNGGIMKLIVSPRLRRDDLDIIMNSLKDSERIVQQRLLEELDQIEDEFARDHVSALGWMVANGRLEIKVAVPYRDSREPLSYEDVEQGGLFHQKVGILRDSMGNIISFSGSINETAAGWLENLEEFKVFRSWEPSESDYVQADTEKFSRFWANRSRRARVIDIPRAVEERLIEIAPADIGEIDLERHYQRVSREGRAELHPHQGDAVNAWLDNNMKGIFAMATGTGKTFAALGCLDRISRIDDRLLVVITCPYQHLVQQWSREIAKFGISYDKLIVADSSNKRWRDEMADALMDITWGHKHTVVVLTTHRTFASDDFIDIIQNRKATFRSFLIADEVHGLGAEKSREGLVSGYDLRLGLSATPRRWFDTAGTTAIYDFFGGEVFQFGLEEAINTMNPATGETYLVPYRYVPRFAFLNAKEMEEYADKTRRIAKLMEKAAGNEERDRYWESLLIARANIIKNAHQKYEVLESILDEVATPIKWTIVYCSPQQIERVMEIVNKRRIIAHRFTMEEGTIPARKYDGLSERDFLLERFANGKYQVLVAMKCLDEGVDVPPARTAILMASSGNPREYIQRIGRVIRRYPGKNKATIYDIVVLPPLQDVPRELRNIEQRIITKELQRYEEIARAAINNAEALAMLSEFIGTLRE
ncbi:MAG: DEAD/DEAH box helicase family protein [Candidatus Methanomethyliaceae archaeon]